MKELIIAPAIMILILGFAIELEEIAKSSTEKALEFAEDMNSAMDCATLGRPIKECSPGLYAADFHDEIDSTMGVLNEMRNVTSLVTE